VRSVRRAAHAPVGNVWMVAAGAALVFGSVCVVARVRVPVREHVVARVVATLGGPAAGLAYVVGLAVALVNVAAQARAVGIVVGLASAAG
jgi:hypothetical protein